MKTSLQTNDWYRSVLIAAGLVTLARAVIGLAQPDYWSPRTPLDYAAVVGTSLSFLLLAAGLWGFFLSHPLLPGRATTAWRMGVILSCISAATLGVSNFLEDALGVRWLGSVWVICILILSCGLLLASISAFSVKEFPGMVGWLLLTGMIGLLFIATYGFFGLGLALLALGLLNIRSKNGSNA